MQALLDTLRDCLPQPLIVGDSTQPVYQAPWLPAPTPNSWFNAGSGCGTAGYGLPAAIGAKLAATLASGGGVAGRRRPAVFQRRTDRQRKPALA